MGDIQLFLICFVLIAIVFILIYIFFNNFFLHSKSYSAAEKYSMKYLDSNINQLTSIAKKVIQKKPNKGFKPKLNNVNYVSYGNGINVEGNYVTFTFEDDGIVGAVDWGLIYSPSNTFENETDLYIYDESKHSLHGNNIFISKKIRKNWFFFYNDWDGHVNLKKISKQQN